MQVQVLFFGLLKDLIGLSEDKLSLPPGSTIASAFQHYAAGLETLQERRSSILFARNHVFVKADTVLNEGDEVAFLPPVSGGSDRPSYGNVDTISSPAEHTVFELTRESIVTQSLVSRLVQPHDGAVVCFEGVVRNNTGGRSTLYLEYDGYEVMALQELARLGKEIAAEHQLSGIGVIHRLGRLAIGETSVAIVVTAPHRRSAFSAASCMIDRLKREVPVWKKEFFEDGAVWVEGAWDEGLIEKAGFPDRHA